MTAMKPRSKERYGLRFHRELRPENAGTVMGCCGQAEGDRAAGPKWVYKFGIWQSIKVSIGGSLRAYLVADHLAVNLIHHFQVPGCKTT